MPAPRKNYDNAVELYNGGMSCPKVAERCGIGTSAMYKILKRRGCEIRDPHRTENSICSVPGCGGPLKAHGLCSRHAGQFYKHGKVISAEKIKIPNGNRRCSVEGCDFKYRSNGYCQGHLGQFKKHGKIVASILAPRNGISKSRDGYVLILKPDHAASDRKGYVKRANLVWEENTGQVVIAPALVHHKNGVKDDDAFGNLEYFASDLEHQAAHHIMKGHKGFIPGGIM